MANNNNNNELDPSQLSSMATTPFSSNIDLNQSLPDTQSELLSGSVSKKSKKSLGLLNPIYSKQELSSKNNNSEQLVMDKIDILNDPTAIENTGGMVSLDAIFAPPDVEKEKSNKGRLGFFKITGSKKKGKIFNLKY